MNGHQAGQEARHGPPPATGPNARPQPGRHRQEARRPPSPPNVDDHQEVVADAIAAAQRLAWHAAILEDRGYPGAPEVRRLTRTLYELATTSPTPAPTPGRCPCGRPLPPPGPKGGRPRRRCPTCSPPETRRRRPPETPRKPRMIA